MSVGYAELQYKGSIIFDLRIIRFKYTIKLLLEQVQAQKKARNSIFVVMGKQRKKQRRDEVLLKEVIMRVKQLREEHGHSQEQLNAGTEIDIANLETGANFPNLTTISIICRFYKITLHEFFAPINYPSKE